MRLFTHVLICLLFIAYSMVLPTRIYAAPAEKTAIPEGESRVSMEMPEGPPPIPERRIALAPFYLFQSKGSKVWMERILVNFSLAAPANRLKHDFDNPTFRKKLYELLRSGEPEAAIQTESLAHLQRQVGEEIEPTVQVSRSVLIVH